MVLEHFLCGVCCEHKIFWKDHADQPHRFYFMLKDMGVWKNSNNYTTLYGQALCNGFKENLSLTGRDVPFL